MRNLQSREQPEMLAHGLQKAEVVTGVGVDSLGVTQDTSAPTRRNRLVTSLLSHVGVTIPERRIILPKVGVPHGVNRAVVYAENVRFARRSNVWLVYFCQSHGWKVLAETIGEFDRGTLPSPENSQIDFGSVVPQCEGFSPVRMRVSINGQRTVQLEKMGASVRDEIAQLQPVGAI